MQTEPFYDTQLEERHYMMERAWEQGDDKDFFTEEYNQIMRDLIDPDFNGAIDKLLDANHRMLEAYIERKADDSFDPDYY